MAFGDQVAHDALDPPHVGLGQARWSGASTSTCTTLVGQRPGRVDDAVRDVDEVVVVELEDGGPGVEAADLDRSASRVSKRSSSVCSSFGGPRRRRVELCARVVEDVAGHPHGRQRRPQLVGDVGDEPALHPAELLELADLALQVARHLVERRREPRQVVLAGHLEPLLQLAGREPLRHLARHPDRVTTWRVTSQVIPGDQHQQQGRRRQQGAGDQRQRLPSCSSSGKR